MYFIALFILSVFIPVVKGGCSDHTDCVKCASSSQWQTKCRWCDTKQTCHAVGSSYNYCMQCNDSSISKICSVTDVAKCDRNMSNEFKSGEFEPNEAYNAVLYSAIAYTDDPVGCAQKLFPDGSFEIVEVVGRKCNYLFEYKECFAVVGISHKANMIILAYRGTNSTIQLIDEFATVLGKFKVTRVGLGNVQAYFSNANDQLYTCVRSCVKDLVKKYPHYKVMIAGHSLGGAIASVASAQLSYDQVISKENTTLYTFGMPRAGDVNYAKTHDRLIPKSWRVVHFRDIVSKLPTKSFGSTSPYHHQREIFYGNLMTPTTDYIECFDYEDMKCGNSFSASLSSVNYHQVYYDIPVGSYCNNKTNRRRKRSDEDSDMGNLFTNETCRRIKVGDLPTSSACKVTIFKTMRLALILIAFGAIRQLPL